MGAWSAEPFGNDMAADLLGNLDEMDGLSAFRALVNDALHAYDRFLIQKERGENIIVWTPEEIQKALKDIGFTPENMDDPRYAESKQYYLSKLGETDVDDGEYTALDSVAAAAIIHAAACHDVNSIRSAADPGVKLELLDDFLPTMDEVCDAVRVLNLIKGNKLFGRTYGARWKKEVSKLLDGLVAHSKHAISSNQRPDSID